MGEIANLIQHGSLHDFPVLDRDRNYLGMIWFHDVREVMLENEMYPLLIAEDVMGDPPPALFSYSSLADALLHFTTADADTLPVFASVSDRHLAGVITRSDLMRCYERELLLREQPSDRR
ncbi:MAG: CBS domain-containing protein [Candidatus Latescibacteria bacterium]|jgi:CIC family chloride channel protein|nr:CBS domain-containing protein [Candidatus Latescibacterota bacterium]